MSLLQGLTNLVAPHPIPFHRDLSTPLLRLGRRDRWCLRDAVEGTAIIGGVGSGKSSGSGQAIALSFLRAGFGGLVLCAKNNEADRWRKLARATGRQHAIITLDESGAERFNFMAYTAATLARDGFDQNLTAALLAAADAARVVKSSSGGDNPFFRDAAEEMLIHALPLLKITQPRLELSDLMRMIDSAPTTKQEARSKAWRDESFCAEVLVRCGDLAEQGHPEARRIADEHGDYWLVRVPSLGERTRSSIVATLTSTINGLLTGRIHELFGTDTTVVPELTQEGAIILLDLSVHEFGTVGAIAQQIFKTLWMKSIQQRPIHANMRPCFLWIDECQYFLSQADADFLSTSREYRACPVYITQDLPTFYAAIGGDNAENVGKQLVAKFQTRVFHANTDPVTNAFASDIIGKTDKKRINRSVNSGFNAGVSGQQGERESSYGGGGGRTSGRGYSIETYEDADIPPEYFGNELRTGGRENRYLVDAIMIRSARRFRSSKRNRLKVTFHQKRPG
ncbi:MAG: TraM recognition domain-containing protein [Pseudomonadota bacterium]